VEKEDDEECPLPLAAERQRLASPPHFERAEQREHQRRKRFAPRLLHL
jgi:hypothetical protein